jgi:hypothetical protein
MVERKRSDKFDLQPSSGSFLHTGKWGKFPRQFALLQLALPTEQLRTAPPKS